MGKGRREGEGERERGGEREGERGRERERERGGGEGGREREREREREKGRGQGGKRSDFLSHHPPTLSTFMMEEKVSLRASDVASFFRASLLSPSRNAITLSCGRGNMYSVCTWYMNMLGNLYPFKMKSPCT